MIILTNPLLLEIVLGSSATTSQLPFYVAYVDSTSITYVPAQLNGLTNNTSIVTLVPTPLAGTSRTIKYVSIHNEDSVSSQVILQINDGVNTKIIVNFTLDSGDRLEYTDTVGFRCLTSTGEVKQGSGGGGIVYPGAGIPISTGTGWSTSITDNSTNWNTAYGWGNHASAGYLTGITSGQVTTALGYTPVTNARTLTINGTTYDLSANRSWTITVPTINPRVQTVTSASTVTPSADNDDEVVITAQGAALTLANWSGTPVQGQAIIIRIKDDGTARAITFDTLYRAVGAYLPTTTVIGKTVYIACIYNSTDTKIDVVSVAQEI